MRKKLIVLTTAISAMMVNSVGAFAATPDAVDYILIRNESSEIEPSDNLSEDFLTTSDQIETKSNQAETNSADLSEENVSEQDQTAESSSNSDPIQSESAQEDLTQIVDESRNKYLMYNDGTYYTGWYEMQGYGKLYFDPENNCKAVKDNIKVIDGNAYLFDSNGVVITESGTPVVNNKKYWIKTDGSLGTGWLYLGNWKMYFDPETYQAKTVTDGVTDINEKKYLFNKDGVMQNYAGTTIIDGKKYWFSTDDASLKTGWLTLGNWKLYFDPETYQCATGITEINGKKYLFDSNGILQTSGTPTINGKKYYVGEDNTLQSGWINLGKYKMYFDQEAYEAATGITCIDEKYYLFDNNGVLQTSGTPKVNNKKYYIAADNTLVSGWVTSGNWTMYYDPKTYEGACGICDIEGKRYIFDSNGILIKGTGTFMYNGKKYAYDGNGNALTGWVKLGKWKMFFDRNTGEAAIGITKIDGKMYMFNNDGVMQDYAGTTIINGKKYWFSDDNASLKSGWLNLNGSRLYFDPNTYAAYTNCTVKIDGYNCRFNKDGVLINDKERDKNYIKNLLTYDARSDIYDGNIDFIRAAKNIVSDQSKGYGHTWPNTISCAGLVGLTLTHLGYGDFIKDDPLGWGYIDLGDEYVSTLINECGATYYDIPINGLNYSQYLQPGDLLYYYYDGTYNHIAIYAGFGYTVEARGPSGATDADDTGYETGIYYLPNDPISFQGFFRLPKLNKIS